MRGCWRSRRITVAQKNVMVTYEGVTKLFDFADRERLQAYVEGAQ